MPTIIQIKLKQQIKRDTEIYEKYGIKSDLLMRIENMMRGK